MGHILILGANSDIAQALAYRYAQEGYNITLAARQINRLDNLVSDITIRYQINVELAEFDALDFESHASFYNELPSKPDVVACVFGYLGTQESAQTDFAEAKTIIDTNYTGAVSILNLVANDFERQKKGAIIGISSVAGDRGRGSNYLYGSAKAGFTAYLSGLRNRLTKSGVQVLTVKPGFVRTKMTQALKLPPVITATPEQVANDIYRANRAGRNVLYTRWMWQFIMLIIRHIPEFVFKRLSL
ncbi:SDR family oxidoreductase [Anaerolineales bacterium HSG24]|nr:SDR family oxidoreductase [Anaerolineales bacterium HSG24]